ncbi:MAG: right-handed parallel beta-helix repeat-containing protein, partial [Promethearchaeia archaeon]
MRSFKTKIKREIIFLLGSCLLLSATFLNMFPLIKVDNLSEKDGNQDHRGLHGAYFNNSMTPIYIDGDATGVGAHNWTWAVNQPWCSGSGTWNDPYVIKNIMIDGKGTENCIEIRDSSVPFIIRNTSLYDASSANYKAAIRLDHVNNSLIIENNCSNNGHIGIILYEHCNNNTIKRNIMHDNQNAGISLR